MIPRIYLVVERTDGKRSEHESCAQVTPDMLAVAEELLVTLTTGERPPLKGLYEVCALAFGTTREEAKDRLTAAFFGMGKKQFDEGKRRA